MSRRPGYDQLDFELLCEELIESGWLNHSRFAESFIRGRRLKGQGPVKISHELRKRGLNESEFCDHLAEYSDWLDLAITQLNKKTSHCPETPQERAKLQRFLQSRGFDFQTIKQALSQLNKTSDSYPE